ncbi:short-chain dehydrogenase [Halarcobacter mediterraneus]|uniref:Short-chain dehydrogenase n=1 Tax=Halarcobacter mediterraneus TaxID=2023153 RepID=A0A4Q1AT90_9BACT|nr:SDR family NAD(P)-dependent oxidoreductase [Halarcobacter mediterraneus]RXK11668.1 short-chain dehydrogenase [Halarcobacter mediterraneus]
MFENKTILITGANGGLAKAFISELLTKNIKKLYCTARDVNSLEDIKLLSEKIEVYSLDITKEEQIKELSLKIDNIDILINNAGVNSGKRIFDETKIDFNVNLIGTLNSCQVLPKKLNKNGLIINITSVLALINLPIMALYCASKSALHSLTQALRAELTKENISVIEVLPGPIDTNMTKGQEMPKTSPKDVVKNIFESLSQNQIEIYPDDFSKMIKERLAVDKENLEREFALSVQ